MPAMEHNGNAAPSPVAHSDLSSLHHLVAMWRRAAKENRKTALLWTDHNAAPYEMAAVVLGKVAAQLERELALIEQGHARPDAFAQVKDIKAAARAALEEA